MTATSPLASDGREPWIFRAASPEDLLVGAHPAAIAGALDPGEELRYLLYSPVWDSRPAAVGAPRAELASHAVAVTSARFVISRDLHHRGDPPQVWSVAFESLLAVELGRSVLTGWLLLRFDDGRQFAELPVIFHATAGGHHFAAAVRAYRRASSPDGGPGPTAGSVSVWDDAWVDRPYGLKEIADDLLLPAEALRERVATREVWRGAKRRAGTAASCDGTAGLLLLTDRGLLHVLRTEDGHRGPMDFGVAATVLPLDGLDRVELGRDGSTGTEGEFLRLVLARRETEWALRVRLVDQPAAAAERFREALTHPHPPGTRRWSW